jgi:hypothetical protein
LGNKRFQRSPICYREERQQAAKSESGSKLPHSILAHRREGTS